MRRLHTDRSAWRRTRPGRGLRTGFLLAALGGILFASGGVSRAAEPTTFTYGDNGYVILDPAHASLYRKNDERLIVAVLECLTVLDPQTGKAKPGAAESWETSADRRTWTFHLRKNAVWSDGSAVTAKDFLRAWTRMLDPFTASNWSWLYRSIKGCATITDNSARAEGFVTLRRGLRELKSSNPNGIPGESLNSLLDDTGVRPFLTTIRKRSVKRMLKWSSDKDFPPEMTDKVIGELKKAKKVHKVLWEDEFERFGKAGSGAYASDPYTLVVQTEGDVPFLPELLARSAFAPLHESIEVKRGQAFHQGDFVNNGPYLLKGRGAYPPEDQPDKRITSIVELVKNPNYNGPNPAKLDRIMCHTDETLQVAAANTLSKMDDVREFMNGKLDWVFCNWPEYPRKDKPRRPRKGKKPPKKPRKRIDLRKEIEALPGWHVRAAPRVIYMRFRCDKPPFNSKEARKAFALALNREHMATFYWPKARPAYRIVPPGIDGRVDGIACARPSENAAKAAFKSAALASDTWVELSFGESPGQDDVAGYLISGWKKILGIEPGTRIESDEDVRNVLRAGAYQVMITDYRGFVNDPYGYLAPLHSADADSGLGWRDEKFDALLDAARDPDIALKDEAGWIAKVGSGLQAALAGAKGGMAGRNSFRHAALAAAERRVLEEYVVVPLLFLNEAVLTKPGIKGMDSAEALKNPGFVGSLIHVSR